MTDYAAQINGATADVYDVLEAFGVTNPGAQHAAKKALLAGKRVGGKPAAQDYREAAAALIRAAELEERQARKVRIDGAAECEGWRAPGIPPHAG